MRKLYLATLAILSFSFFINQAEAQTVNLKLIAGQNGTHLYQLDTTGLGNNVQIGIDLTSIGSVEFISILDDYKLNYVTRQGIGEFCCVTVFLMGDSGSRQYEITFDIREDERPSQKIFLKLGETLNLDIPVFEDADSIRTNLNDFSGGVYAEYQTITNEFANIRVLSITGIRHGLEIGYLEHCNLAGDQCEVQTFEIKVMDPSKFQLEPLVDTAFNWCSGGYQPLCLPIKRTDKNFDDFEYLIDGVPYEFLGYLDTCGQQVESVKYRLGNTYYNNTVPHKVLFWEVDGVVYKDFVFRSHWDLMNWMDVIIADGDWEWRSSSIQGTRNGRSFGLMEVVNLETGILDEFGEEYASRWIDFTHPPFPEGEYELSIHYPNFEFTSTTSVEIDCPDFSVGTEYFYDTLFVGESKTVGVFSSNLLNVNNAGSEYLQGDDLVIGFDYAFDRSNLRYSAYAEGEATFRIILCDPNFCDTLIYNVVGIEQGPPPTGMFWIVPPGADEEINCNLPLNFLQAKASSDCVGDVTVSYSDQILPNTCTEVHIRTWTATDECGNSLIGTQTITKIDLDAPFIENAPPDEFVLCQETIPYSPPEFRDFCDADLEIMYQDDVDPTACPNALILRTWTATDNCNNIVEYIQRIERVNDGPFMETPPDPVTDLTCGDTIPFLPPTFIHECGLDFTLTYVDEVRGSGLCDGEVERFWTAEDECGVSVMIEQNFHFMDHEPPMFEGQLPMNITIDQTAGEQIPPFWQATATDNCDTDVEINFRESQVATGDMETVQLHRTYDAIDDCGMAAHHHQIITVITNPVWPGDTDDDGDVDGEDLFPIGFAFGERGPQRSNSDWFFSPQPILDWDRNLPGAGNYKHIDSDGSGEIGFWDTMAIQINWGLFHPKEIDTKAILLQEDLRTEFVSLDANGWAHFNVILGDRQTMISDFYGLAFDFLYDAALIHPDSAIVDYTDSWAGSLNNDLLTVQKNFGGDKILRTSLVRTDNDGKNDSGKIASVRLKLRPPYPATITATIPGARGIYADGSPYTSTDFSETFDLTSSTKDLTNQINFEIAPNPTDGDLYLKFLENESKNYRIEILDLLGRKLMSYQSDHRSRMKVELGDLLSGSYFIQISYNQKFATKRIIISNRN